MNPKCKYCGKELSRKESFKVVVGGKNAYYCNESEYQIVVDKENDRKMLFSVINDIFGYEVINTVLYKDIHEMLISFNIKTVIGYLKDNQKHIYDIINSKSFSSEYGKIKYFMAILKNNIKDYTPYIPEPPKEVEVDIIENQKFSRKKKRRSMYEIEMGVDTWENF